MVAAALGAALLAGCSADPSAAAGRLAVEAYVERGRTPRRVSRPRADEPRPSGSTRDPGRGRRVAPRPARGHRGARTDRDPVRQHAGAPPEQLLVRPRRLLPDIGTALLSSKDHRTAVADELARRARALGMRGVQIDLESLRARDRPGLTAFARTLADAVHRRLGRDARVSIAVMARRPGRASSTPATTSAGSPASSTASCS